MLKQDVLLARVIIIVAGVLGTIAALYFVNTNQKETWDLSCSFGAFTTPFVLGAIGLLTQNGMLVFAILGSWLIVTSIFVMYLLQKRA